MGRQKGRVKKGGREVGRQKGIGGRREGSWEVRK